MSGNYRCSSKKGNQENRGRVMGCYFSWTVTEGRPPFRAVNGVRGWDSTASSASQPCLPFPSEVPGRYQTTLGRRLSHQPFQNAYGNLNPEEKQKSSTCSKPPRFEISRTQNSQELQWFHGDHLWQTSGRTSWQQRLWKYRRGCQRRQRNSFLKGRLFSNTHGSSAVLVGGKPETDGTLGSQLFPRS